LGRFKLSRTSGFNRKPSESVEEEEDNLSIRRFDEIRDRFEIHFKFLDRENKNPCGRGSSTGIF
jgi:hypothetical protein